jgi:hypothetical protein
MIRSEAVNLARMEVMGNFTVLDVWSFVDEKSENETVIRLVKEREGFGTDDVGELEENEVYYVTFGWDSTQGDGSFRVTVRVGPDGVPKVVDFETNFEAV